ncbi:MAG TPA: MBL fold metallo-hydrolase [Pseudobdellovibrionaceae bacterium]|nr:MBL fold metallo-hydrolase [Pseudobdellovibrionaceae bacterium]
MTIATASKIQLQIGDYQICPIPTGIFALDGGAMFGTVPKVLWEKSNPADSQNRIPMEARALLLKSPQRNILIDTGNGSDFVEKYGEKIGGKFAEIYAVEKGSVTLQSSLAKFGLKNEDITDVILTHLHFDHAGGATRSVNGKIVPAFPKAKYYIQAANLETATKPNLRERASYFAANFQPILDAGQMTVLNGSQENIVPGVSLAVSNGHTQGQQIVKVSDGQQSLVYCADMVPTSSHVRLAWLMGYDLNPLLLMEEKVIHLNEAAEKNTYLFFEHDPYCDAALIQKHGHDFAIKERFHL